MSEPTEYRYRRGLRASGPQFTPATSAIHFEAKPSDIRKSHPQLSPQLDEVALIALTLNLKAFMFSKACRVNLQLERKEGWMAD